MIKKYIPGRSLKKNMKSFYYDRETGLIRAAKKCPTWPCCRPTRYIYLGQYKRHKSHYAILSDIFIKTGVKEKPKVVKIPFPPQITPDYLPF